MNKKVIKLLALMMLGILVVTGCGKSGSTEESSSDESSGEKTVINFYYWDEGQQEGMDALIELFEESQDEIVVESTIVPFSEYFTKLQTSLPTGTGPDVFWMNMYAPDYIDAGLLLDLTDALESAGVDMSKYPEAVTEMYESDGLIYGVPKDYDGMALYYNKAIFDELGVEYPQEGWTWDDLLETAQALTNENYYGFVARSDGNCGYQNFVYQNGGSLTDENYMPTVNTEAVVEAIQFEHDLMYEYNVSPTGAELLEFSADDMFVAGQVAMITSGSWSIQTYVEALGEDCQVAELPMNVTQGATTHGLAYCVAANSSNTEAALEFVTFAATQEAQEATASAAIPAYEGAAEVWLELYPDQDVQILLDSVEYASPNPYYANNYSEAAQILTDTISDIWIDENADIQAMLDEAQEKMTEIVNEE